MSGYPITLVGLENTRCVVVGGGEVAARKVTALREAGARPVVVSPTLCEGLRQQSERGEIQAVWRPYCAGDLNGARLAIAATDDPAINEAVWRDGQAVGCLVNVVDYPARCNFYVPATVRRGALTLSVSTGGASPLLARRIRELLDQQFDAAYEPFLALLGELRPLVQARVADVGRRKALWEALLDSEILGLLRSGSPQVARQRAQDIIETFC
ncbi:MAG: bifunctional precorrin-2 dehydrogenase/sirohydrochlorin ferrochelatase [Ardenticatenia bacterium]|nr:bifunctional precorrin-2 dehydrogenase/sirohydrochlorin ferrochelatase [Ardenticatenia bacterium]